MNICKITNNKTKKVIDFGKMPISNFFLKKENFKNEFFYNLEVSFSEKISLFQINDYPKPEMMFNKNYPFFTSSSNFMKKHFHNYANWAKKKYLNPNSKIIEIGSNDGTFLQNFIKTEIHDLGFDPSRNVSDIAKKKGINSIPDFFSSKNISKAEKFIGNTDVIFGANVVCHIPDLVDFIKTCNILLNDDGKIIFEEPYLGAMYDKVSYDQIYDEHIFIFSISSIKNIFNLFDFELIDAYPQITHGGSMRYVLQRKRQSINLKKISKLIEYEKRKNINNISGAIEFASNCTRSKEILMDKIYKIKKSGKKICGYGATSKSTTILNYCKINDELIDCIFDTTQNKIGKYSPGMHIPIVDYKKFNKKFYEYSFLFAWNHMKEIEKKEKKYLKSGGKWITHLLK